MYDAIILKDLTNGKKKNSADFENSYLAKNRFDGFESPCATHFLSLCDPCLGRDPYFKNHCTTGYIAPKLAVLDSGTEKNKSHVAKLIQFYEDNPETHKSLKKKSKIVFFLFSQ